jgi:hypothetical protein
MLGHGGLMTIEVGTQKLGRVGRRGRQGRSQDTASMPIGEVDANIFACPGCSRPLGAGTRRCPSCGTGLIAGVRASRVLVFVGIGLFSGMIASAGLMALMSRGATAPADVAVVPPAPIVQASQVPIVPDPAPAAVTDIPSNAVSALRQSTFLNQRVMGDAARLTAVLSEPRPSGSEIAPILRSLASSAAFGARLAPSVGEWDKGAAVSQDLTIFYADIAGKASEGLSASLADSRSFVSTARQMLRILAGLDGIDAASRTLAGSADIELPPLEAPTQ